VTRNTEGIFSSETSHSSELHGVTNQRIVLFIFKLVHKRLYYSSYWTECCCTRAPLRSLKLARALSGPRDRGEMTLFFSPESGSATAGTHTLWCSDLYNTWRCSPVSLFPDKLHGSAFTENFLIDWLSWPSSRYSTIIRLRPLVKCKVVPVLN
jgi:hypothetical protein